MNYDLTVLVSGMRVNLWSGLYESIDKATKKLFEVIFVGPNFPPIELQNCPNIKFVRDFGSPSRCKQIGLQLATGTYTTWASDDAPFLEGAIDKMFDILFKGPYFDKNVVTGKYYEGRQIAGSDDLHLSDKYYYLNYHNATRSPYYPDSWLIFLTIRSVN